MLNVLGTLCLSHLRRRQRRWNRQGVPKLSAYKIHTPGNYPEESVQHSEHGESLKQTYISVSASCTGSPHEDKLQRTSPFPLPALDLHMKTSRRCKPNASSSSQFIKITRIVKHGYSRHSDITISSCPSDCNVLVYSLCMKTLQSEDRDVATVVIMLPYGVTARQKRPTPHKPQVIHDVIPKS